MFQLCFVSLFNIVVSVKVPLRGCAWPWQVRGCTGLWKFLRITETHVWPCLAEGFMEKRPAFGVGSNNKSQLITQ